MTQASLSPSSAAAPGLRFAAGPLDIRIDVAPGSTADLLASTLSLYDVEWTLTPMRPVDVSVGVVDDEGSAAARGDYMACAQMLVDTAPDGLWATTSRGATMRGRFAEASEMWHLVVPPRVADEGWWPEIEDLVSLIVTTGWRRAGWVPLHAAGLTKDGRGVIACASSRGGKTTFTLAMAKRGWRVVGDDKLLLRTLDGQPVIAGIKHVLNVDPAVRGWFPEVGDLNDRPLYSEWSPKRRVPLGDIFPGAATGSMSPTHLVELSRGAFVGGLRVHRLSSAESISVLLHQTVIPNDPLTARQITGAVAGLALRMDALRVEVPDSVYDDPDALAVVEQALS